MDKRSIIALVLIGLVIFGGQLLMPRAPAGPLSADSTAPLSAAKPDSLPSSIASPPVAQPPVVVPSVSAAPALVPRAATAAIRADTVVVTAKGRVGRFMSPGATPGSITLTDYKDLKRKDGPLSLVSNAGPLLHYRLVSAADTIDFDHLAFTTTVSGTTTEFVSPEKKVRVRYDMSPDDFVTHVTVSAPGAAKGALLLIDLPSDLRTGEADTTEDLRHLAYGYRHALRDVQSVTLDKLDTLQYTVETGPLEWVAARNKYFVFAVLAGSKGGEFVDFRFRGGHRKPGGHATGIATATMPMTTDGFSFDLYTGPQSWKALRAVGHDLVNVNPYAGWAWLRPVVQPFATIVMRLLLGLQSALGLSYGWVLVIFGIVIRLLLWPLNQTAMRTSIKMQRLQPELATLQKRYAKDPEGQRVAMVKLYQDHGMSPFSPLMGCLPMLIPMPILFALFFVFQNTIEFRGVSFLWLPDISLKDPYYITPILMGVSMLVLSWIGMRAAPQNPQAKVMGYMMPAMFTVMFLNFASGLNLYYAVQNLVAIPQQWFLTNERAKAGGNGTAKGAVVSKAPK